MMNNTNSPLCRIKYARLKTMTLSQAVAVSFAVMLLRFLLGGTAFAADQFNMPAKPEFSFRNDTINIASQGGKGDGAFLNTGIINKAISLLHGRGGGVVLVPAGLWLTGPIELLSHVNLHLAQGATLLFTADLGEYKLVQGNWEGLPQMRNQSPISAVGQQHIAITGKGIVDGNGDAWRMVKKDKLTASQWKQLLLRGGVLSKDGKTWYPSAQSLYGASLSNPGVITPEKTPAFYDSVKDFLRPNMVLLDKCDKVLLQGVIFQNSPEWCLHPLMSSNIVVNDITVKNPWYAQNGDGIDVESCTNVWITNSVFDVGDDALCMKSGRDAAGRARAMPTQHVLIEGCTVYASHGGFVIGSEMSGGVRQVKVTNCTFIGSDIGLRFKSARGRGGIVEDIFIDHIYMKDIPGDAILFDMYYMAKDPIPLDGEKRELPAIEEQPKDETTPVFRNFNISHVYCNGAQRGLFIRGLPEQHVEEISLSNMILQAKEGAHIQDASSIALDNVAFVTPQNEAVIDIIRGAQLQFRHVQLPPAATNWYRIAGKESEHILITPGGKNMASKVKTELGASAASVKIE